jgi:uncharacterized protein YndB with AHSA1/START domain
MSNIEQSYEISASAEAVFRAISDASLMSKWWITRGQSDAKTGGSFEYVWEFENDQMNGKQMGAYTSVESGKSLSYPWDIGQSEPTQVALSVAGNGQSATVSLVHSGWEGEGLEEAREGIAQAWGFFLGNLKAYLEDGADGRSAAMGQITE